MPPPFAPAFLVQGHPVPPGGGRPAGGTYPVRVPQTAIRPGPAPAQPALPRPIVRAQAPDEPSPPPRPLAAERRPPLLSIPTPEQLGLGGTQPPDRGPTDWTAVHRRLDQFGATCLHLEKLPQGGCRFTCLLPTGQPDRSHRVEAQAASEAEAVHLVLQKTEEWAGRKMTR
jgi:hypothetical protein